MNEKVRTFLTRRTALALVLVLAALISFAAVGPWAASPAMQAPILEDLDQKKADVLELTAAATGTFATLVQKRILNGRRPRVEAEVERARAVEEASTRVALDRMAFVESAPLFSRFEQGWQMPQIVFGKGALCDQLLQTQK